MSTLSKFRAVVLLALCTLILSACDGSAPGTGDGDSAGGDNGTPSPAGGADSDGPVEVRWFVGLGTGHNPEQVEAQNAVVERFNETHDHIQLVIELVANDVAYDTLATQIAAGNAPDIVGPVGIRGANAFNDRWLDLEPLVESSGYDLSRFAPEQVDVWRTDEGLVGLPFGAYPAMIFYNKALFDEAGLAYPPSSFGEDYEGQPWDMDTLAELAKQLTVDANGNDATDLAFDPGNIVQFGFEEQWSAATRFAAMFGAGEWTDGAGNAHVPDVWREAFDWYYRALWEDHAIPNDEYRGSDLLAAGNPFDSGNVAMAHTHLWYTCCLEGVEDWDLAPVPSYNGVTTSGLHADVFRILDTTEHPEESFEVLTFLIEDAAPELLAAYGAMPSDPAFTDTYFAGLRERYPSVSNWQIAVDSLQYPDIPSHEADMPNFQKADERVAAFWSELNSSSAVNVEQALDTLVADLQGIYDEVE